MTPTDQRQRLFGSAIIMASVTWLVWTSAKASPLNQAPASHWMSAAALVVAALIGGVICNKARS